VANFELVFPSREVVRVDWFAAGWFMLVGKLFSTVISMTRTSKSKKKKKR